MTPTLTRTSTSIKPHGVCALHVCVCGAKGEPCALRVCRVGGGWATCPALFDHVLHVPHMALLLSTRLTHIPMGCPVLAPHMPSHFLLHMHLAGVFEDLENCCCDTRGYLPLRLPPPPPPFQKNTTARGSRFFACGRRRGGGGGSIEPPKTGGWVFGKRAQLAGPLISYYEFWCQRRQNFFER